MSADLYPDAEAPIREDILEHHARALQHIAAPGAWFSGAERVAIAAETRLARCLRALSGPERRPLAECGFWRPHPRRAVVGDPGGGHPSDHDRPGPAFAVLV